MKFPEHIVQQAWERASGYCECNRNYHCHKEDNQPCKETLVWEHKDREGIKGSWYAHHIIPTANGGPNEVSNCEILCYECYKSAGSYGLF